jgi:hypothetical protein
MARHVKRRGDEGDTIMKKPVESRNPHNQQRRSAELAAADLGRIRGGWTSCDSRCVPLYMGVDEWIWCNLTA